MTCVFCHTIPCPTLTLFLIINVISIPGYCLTCATYPRSDLILELQDEDETFIKQWSEGFEGGGVEWGGVFMDED